MHRRCLCTFTALTCLLTQAAFARNIFVTPNDSSSTLLASVSGDPFNFGTSLSTVLGATAVLPSANAQKFYVIGSGTSDNLGILTGRFPNLTSGNRIQIGGAITTAKVTGDGRRLIAVGPSGTAIVDTTTDGVIRTVGNIDTGNSPIDVATSVDSRYAYILSASSGRLTSIDLNSNTIAATAQVPSSATSLAVGPAGLIYVGASNSVYELDPVTLAVRAIISVVGTPDALQFTPNGRFGVARNLITFSGRSLVVIDLQTRRAIDTQNAVAFTAFALIGDDLAYGIVAPGTLVEIRLASDGTVTQLPPVVNNGTLPSNITDIAATGELPRSQSLILAAGGFAYRLDTATRELQGPISVNLQGNLSNVVPLSTGSVQGILSYNTSQTVPAGSTSLPLTVVAYDSNGFPTSGATVSYSTTAPNITFSSPGAVTNMMGIASTTVAIPAGRTGSIPVIATLGQRTASFTINIGDPGPGPGPGSGVGRFTIISGQGEVVLGGFGTDNQEPLRVRYLDANGNVIAGAQIEWSVVEGNAFVRVRDGGLTNGDGVSEANLSTSVLPTVATPFLRYAVRAAAPDGQSQLFYVTAVRSQRAIGGISVGQNVPPGSTITARSGEIVAGAFVFQIRSSLDAVNVPSVGLKVVSANLDPNFGPVAECRGGPTVFSDALGNATCDLVITGRPGSTPLTVNVGAGASLYTYQLTVTTGAPATVRVVSGNNQSGNPGQQLSALVVEVVDPAGNLLPGIGVDWNIPSSAAVINIQRVTDANGRASATINLPTAPGQYSIQATAGTASAVFTITGNAVAGNLNLTGGDAQTAIVGQQFGQQLQVSVVNPTGGPVSGVTVAFTLASGNAIIASPSVVTDSSGRAATTVTAGNTAGAIVINATTGNFRVTFNLSARLAGPVFTAASIVNGASFQPGISPGSIAFIRVAGIAPNLRGSITPKNIVGPLPTSLSEVQVLIGGIAAPIYAVSNINGEESVSVQVPFEVPVGTTSITIQGPGGGSTSVSGVEVKAFRPGVFTYTDSANNATYSVAVRPDGSFVSSSNPARRGEVIRIYATGLGQTSPATATNRVGASGQSVAAPLIVGVNNAGTRLVSAELMPGTVGVYVVALQIPDDALTGPTQPIGLAAVGPTGAEFANAVFLPIL